MKIYRQLSIIGLILTVFMGCTRRPLEERDTPSNYAEITVVFDWGKSNIRPTGMTAIFYPTSGGASIVHRTASDVSVVRLPKGVYNMIAFNYTFSEFDAISFRGMERYETIEAFAKPLANAYIKASKVNNLIDHPDILAVDNFEGFEVTAEMVTKTQQVKALQASQKAEGISTRGDVVATVTFTPIRIVAPGTVKVHMQGLNYVRSAIGTLDGVVSSVFLADKRKGSTPCSVRFPFGNPQYYSSSKINGTVEGHFTTFGLIPLAGANADAKYQCTFSAILVDKEKSVFEQVFDVTGDIIESFDPNYGTVIRVRLELGQSATPGGAPTIVIPEVVPEGGGGFQVGVGEWGDEEEQELDVK